VALASVERQNARGVGAERPLKAANGSDVVVAVKPDTTTLEREKLLRRQPSCPTRTARRRTRARCATPSCAAAVASVLCRSTSCLNPLPVSTSESLHATGRFLPWLERICSLQPSVQSAPPREYISNAVKSGKYESLAVRFKIRAVAFLNHAQLSERHSGDDWHTESKCARIEAGESSLKFTHVLSVKQVCCAMTRTRPTTTTTTTDEQVITLEHEN
jgi:hypothetical protein